MEPHGALTFSVFTIEPWLPMRTANILRIAIPFLDPNRESLKRRGAEILILGYTNTLPELNGGRVNVWWGG
jgi:hypothetical protein